MSTKDYSNDNKENLNIMNQSKRWVNLYTVESSLFITQEGQKNMANMADEE